MLIYEPTSTEMPKSKKGIRFATRKKKLLEAYTPQLWGSDSDDLERRMRCVSARTPVNSEGSLFCLENSAFALRGGGEHLTDTKTNTYKSVFEGKRNQKWDGQ